MDANSAKQEIDLLRAEIARHEHLYRKLNNPEISDDDFDKLMRKLRMLESEFPQFNSPDSPTHKIGSDSSAGFANVAHLAPMLSLDNVFNWHELDDFDARLHKILGKEGDFEYCIEPKIDGAGISAVYENGILVRLLTRGDGEKGDDITRNAFAVKNLPAKLSGKNPPELLEIRGECYMERAEFDRIKSEMRRELISKAIAKLSKNNDTKNFLTALGESNEAKLPPEKLALIEKKLPANPRNLAAGTMKLLDRKILKSRSLNAIFYSVGSEKGFKISKQTELPERLNSLGLPSVNWFKSANGTKGAFERIVELEDIRSDFPYNTDGAVIKLDDCTLHDMAGFTSHSPRWAVAWKYRAERAKTKLKDITIQVGRTGAITPVAELESVYLSGTTVSRATLHNADYIAQKDIRIGDEVIIEKAGEIIPAIIESIPESRSANSIPFKFPKCCPKCGTTLKKFGEKMLFRCPNIECPAQIEERLIHFASRDCMDIRGLGEASIKILAGKLGVHDFADIYDITAEKLLSEDYFKNNNENAKNKTVENLLKGIAESKNRELWRLIFGLGILEIGEKFAKELALHFGTLDALMNASVEDLGEISGLGIERKPSKLRESILDENPEREGAVRALSIRAYFDDPNNRKVIEKLRKHGLNFTQKPVEIEKDSPFSGKLFALTGTLKSMSRAIAKRYIENLGGKISSSVTKNTYALIAAGNMEGNKLAKASELGTLILDENDFLKMIGKISEENKQNVKPETMGNNDTPTSKISTSKKSPNNGEQLTFL